MLLLLLLLLQPLALALAVLGKKGTQEMRLWAMVVVRGYVALEG